MSYISAKPDFFPTGEGVAFLIGWNLILEYAIGTASVARGYSGYLDSLLNKSMETALTDAMPINVSHFGLKGLEIAFSYLCQWGCHPLD
jgi:hypothetical protein